MLTEKIFVINEGLMIKFVTKEFSDQFPKDIYVGEVMESLLHSL
jgi:hypothetical protein